MNSPITGKPMQLVKEPSSLQFRKEAFEVVYHAFECADSGERFTTDELDQINLNQVHNQYREKYGIPFTHEIREIREKYGVSSKLMSEILGFGANSYRLYESGEMPSVANGRLILAINEPEDFLKQVEASSHLLAEKETARIVKNVEDLKKHEDASSLEAFMAASVFKFDGVNEFSGYRRQSLTKIAHLISFFAQEMELFKTKLNKLLFFTDFGTYKSRGCSVTGLSYRAIPFGPVPAEYDKLYLKLAEDGLIEMEQKPISGNFVDSFKGLVTFNSELFDEEELEVMQKVLGKFKKVNSKTIVELSHQEKAWLENEKGKNLISYQKYAFDLVNLG
ncbi:type II toxin-antitoxin system antitoxin SocA domain-containing protein [Rufibacter immobilis]|uniref:type II toxin-antitoxin system antitoxin SocA domain-containing protein n=1 Tax=Rufibacter immobilis TaxID=1348778 RepID=UPI0035E5040B